MEAISIHTREILDLSEFEPMRWFGLCAPKTPQLFDQDALKARGYEPISVDEAELIMAANLYCPHGEPSAHHCQRCQDEAEPVDACPACGDPIDYCQGHGEIGDSLGFAILEQHDAGNHYMCHPAGCEAAADIQDESRRDSERSERGN